MKRLLLFILLLIALLLSACSKKSNIHYPTTDQKEILFDLGFSISEINEMKEKGIPASTYIFVTKAEEILECLEEKYNISFQVKGGQAPSLLTTGYEFYCCAAEGPLKNIEFTVYCTTDEDKTTIEEGYYGLLKAYELEEELNNQMSEKEYEIKILLSTYCAVPLDYDNENIDAFKEGCTYVYCFMASEFSEEEFLSLSKELESSLREEGYWVDFRSYHVSNDDILDTLNTADDIYDKYDGKLLEDGLADIKYDNGEITRNK